MLRRALFLGLAAVSALALSTPSHAGSIPVPVHEDAGGGGIDVFGTATGATANTTAYRDEITAINFVPQTIPLFLSLSFTDVGGVITGGGFKVIGTGGTATEAIISFSITSGDVVGSSLILDGKITAIGTNNLPGFDFTPLLLGANAIDINHAGIDFANIVGHAGHSAIGSGLGLSQFSPSVPEPASMALLGIGMTGFLAFRRLFKRTSVA